MSSLSIATICLASSFLLSRYYPLTSSLLTTFLVLYGVVSFSRATYAVIPYPHFLSPIRHLPSPPGGNLFMGHLRDTLSQPSGAPQIAYMRSVPNRGMIQYQRLFNQEYIQLTSPEILKELMHTQPYTFNKPGTLRLGTGKGPSRLRALPFEEGGAQTPTEAANPRVLLSTD